MKKPDMYLYPAIFTYEDGYEIAVTFPDLPGCATSGRDEADALTMGHEALGGHLWCMEEDNDPIPAATPLHDISLAHNERAVLVEVYMPSIRLANVNRSISRTVTLPAWLNALAQERGVNFSQTLQAALMQQLDVRQS